ncbi:MAG: hypothetical protein A2977_02215 [Alphaproteobacteria bacterium RIFCSPLOWO2_01_FULL_45_8]|nr:MAG: hypothetical protein A3K20_01425 [Alphaproteobacteria bacterium GWA1_45_9]OFW89890.1 MAG: hypothetical protein A2621_03310 [Alphaproteobacteria bacterium RIFCSPHIGHO2_01_FULL_41_14]OFW96472.1 MAG: hypothetical protein A2977_02215 [Alphaproteobacteria bacterium RIFCSPLOWO2_01_FULL_45_8]HLB58498.1 NUDIX domain-containing protein [Bdellovibrionota bacterium]
MPPPKTSADRHVSYHVGLKILLRRQDEFLFLKSPFSACFDLPGGRIGTEEKITPLKDILQREVKEELGGTLHYQLGKPAFLFRRYFPTLKLNVFLSVYEATYISGNLQLSSEHTSYHWINPIEFLLKENHFLSKEEYLGFKTYFQQTLKDKEPPKTSSMLPQTGLVS